jgi:hypothetical protein
VRSTTSPWLWRRLRSCHSPRSRQVCTLDRLWRPCWACVRSCWTGSSNGHSARCCAQALGLMCLISWLLLPCRPQSMFAHLASKWQKKWYFWVRQGGTGRGREGWAEKAVHVPAGGQGDAPVFQTHLP